MRIIREILDEMIPEARIAFEVTLNTNGLDLVCALEKALKEGEQT